jgi:hypothetical protein
MKPDVGFKDYFAFQDTLTPYIRDRYWGVTNEMVLLKERVADRRAGIINANSDNLSAALFDPLHIFRRGEEGSILQRLHSQAVGLNNTILESEKDDKVPAGEFEQRHVLALSFLLARANTIKGPDTYFESTIVRFYTDRPDQVNHPYSRNRVEIDIPGPHLSVEPVTIPTNLLL